MSDSDKMRAEFETAAREHGLFLGRLESGDYHFNSTKKCWLGFQLGYQAGRKAERESMRLKNWDGIRLGTTHKPEGTNERGRGD